jgi:hypothetical protein
MMPISIIKLQFSQSGQSHFARSLFHQSYP